MSAAEDFALLKQRAEGLPRGSGLRGPRAEAERRLFRARLRVFFSAVGASLAAAQVNWLL